MIDTIDARILPLEEAQNNPLSTPPPETPKKSLTPKEFSNTLKQNNDYVQYPTNPYQDVYPNGKIDKLIAFYDKYREHNISPHDDANVADMEVFFRKLSDKDLTLLTNLKPEDYEPDIQAIIKPLIEHVKAPIFLDIFLNKGRGRDPFIDELGGKIVANKITKALVNENQDIYNLYQAHPFRRAFGTHIEFFIAMLEQKGLLKSDEKLLHDCYALREEMGEVVSIGKKPVSEVIELNTAEGRKKKEITSWIDDNITRYDVSDLEYKLSVAEKYRNFALRALRGITQKTA